MMWTRSERAGARDGLRARLIGSAEASDAAWVEMAEGGPSVRLWMWHRPRSIAFQVVQIWHLLGYAGTEDSMSA